MTFPDCNSEFKTLMLLNMMHITAMKAANAQLNETHRITSKKSCFNFTNFAVFMHDHDNEINQGWVFGCKGEKLKAGDGSSMKISRVFKKTLVHKRKTFFIDNHRL